MLTEDEKEAICHITKPLLVSEQRLVSKDDALAKEKIAIWLVEANIGIPAQEMEIAREEMMNNQKRIEYEQEDARLKGRRASLDGIKALVDRLKKVYVPITVPDNA